MIHFYISYKMKETMKGITVEILWGLAYAIVILSACYLLFATPDTWSW